MRDVTAAATGRKFCRALLRPGLWLPNLPLPRPSPSRLPLSSLPLPRLLLASAATPALAHDDKLSVGLSLSSLSPPSLSPPSLSPPSLPLSSLPPPRLLPASTATPALAHDDKLSVGLSHPSLSHPSLSHPSLSLPRLLLAALLASAATPALAHDDTLSIGLSLEPPTLDPTANPAEPIRSITNGNVFEGLTRIDQDGHVQPLLATSWTISPDGLRYDLHLQGPVRFQDGTPFDCTAVRFAYTRAAAPGSVNPQKQFFTPISKIDCPSPTEAIITLSHPQGSFLYDMAWPEAAMVSPATVATNATHPVGTGPYAFSSWRRGDSVTLLRNPSYWGQKPKIGTVTFRFIADPLAATNALEGGSLDAFPSFPSHELLARFRNDPKFAVVYGTFPIKILLALNEARHPFDDIRVRRALAYAIDRNAILQALNDGQGTMIGSHMSPSDPDYVDLSGRYPYDPDKAKQLLAQAGVKPGTTIPITIPPVDYARKTGELVAAYLAQVGLNATLVPVEWPQWLGQVFAHANYDATIIGHTEPHDLDIYTRPGYYFGYHSPAYDALYHQYEASSDAAERHSLSARLQQMLADDEPNVFLFSEPRPNVWNAKLQGMWHNQPIAEIPVAGTAWAP